MCSSKEPETIPDGTIYKTMDYFLPCHGVFLIIQLDAVQTVKHLEDPLLTAAAKQMRPRQYVGFVHEVCERLP